MVLCMPPQSQNKVQVFFFEKLEYFQKFYFLRTAITFFVANLEVFSWYNNRYSKNMHIIDTKLYNYSHSKVKRACKK